MEKTDQDSTVNMDNIDVDSPQVELEESVNAQDSLTLSVNPIEYRVKRILCTRFSLYLKNAVVAYIGSDAIRIDKCIDYFYSTSPELAAAVKKSAASARASGLSCVLLNDEEGNFYVCSLNTIINYSAVSANDDFSTEYGGLTRLEARDASYAANLKITSLITSDGYLLIKKKNNYNLFSASENYYRVMEDETLDPVSFMVYAVKIGSLEKLITGVGEGGESFG